VKKKIKKNTPLKSDIMAEVERLASMEPELAELEIPLVAKTFEIPKGELRGFVKKRRRDLEAEANKKAQAEARLIERCINNRKSG